eukprot:Pgem_evm1s8795
MYVLLFFQLLQLMFIVILVFLYASDDMSVVDLTNDENNDDDDVVLLSENPGSGGCEIIGTQGSRSHRRRRPTPLASRRSFPTANEFPSSAGISAAEDTSGDVVIIPPPPPKPREIPEDIRKANEDHKLSQDGTRIQKTCPVSGFL